MLYLYAIVEDRRASEDKVILSYLIGACSILAAIEPHQIHDAGAVGEVGYDALLARSHWECLKTQDMAHYLYKRHVASQFVYGVEPRAVHIFIWIVLQQVTIGFNAEFLAQHLLAVGAYARQVHDVLLQYIHVISIFLLSSDRTA